LGFTFFPLPLAPCGWPSAAAAVASTRRWPADAVRWVRGRWSAPPLAEAGRWCTVKAAGRAPAPAPAMDAREFVVRKRAVLMLGTRPRDLEAAIIYVPVSLGHFLRGGFGLSADAEPMGAD